MEPFFPPGANPKIVAWVFVIALAVFHVVFIYCYKLGKRGWKIVDYFWLAAAGLGLVGGWADARMTSAMSQIALYKELAGHARETVASFASSFSPGTAFCGPSMRSQYSPPEHELQRIDAEIAAQCGWFQNVASVLNATSPGIVGPAMFPLAPPVTLTDLKRIQAEFWQQVQYCNQSFARLAKLQDASERTSSEQSFRLVWPLILAIALALRMSKVTGEILLD